MSTQSSIQSIQQEIIQEFSGFTSWEDKYKHLIQLGKKQAAFPEEHRLEKNLVSGCQSQVWLHAELSDGRLKLHADSDAMIVKGLVSLLIRFYSEQPLDEILQAQPKFIQEIGMDKHLSMNRSNGLAAMVKQIKLYALAFKTLSA
jgi:cysteine desulfuration protein SufE